MFWLQGSTFITLLAMNTLVILQKLEGELYLMILLMCNCLSIRNKDSNGFFQSTHAFGDQLIYSYINRNLLNLHRIATLRHDELGQVFLRPNVSIINSKYMLYSFLYVQCDAGDTSEPSASQLPGI